MPTDTKPFKTVVPPKRPDRPAETVEPEKQKLAIPHAALEWIAADAFTVDPSYDRPANEGRINYLAEHWKDEALGVVFASRREDEDKLYLLDGQHRVNALRKQGRKTELVPTLVFDGLSVPQEAEIFVLMNKNRRAPSPSELFRASLVEGNPGAIEIQRVMDGLGLKLSTYEQTSESVRCVESIWRIYRAMGAAGVDAVLSLIMVTWTEPRSRAAFHDRLVVGLGRILFFGEGKLDIDRLRTVLSKDSPEAWISKAGTILAMQGGDRTLVLGDTIVGAYNRGLPQSKQLPAELVRKRRPDPFTKATHYRRSGSPAAQ